MKKCHPMYSLCSGEEYAFSMKSVGEERFEQGSKIILTIPSFTIFIMGDLAYYAGALGMPNSSSYWCPWCFLSHPEWQLLPSSQPAEECTADF
jgi:hypothetical protein